MGTVEYILNASEKLGYRKEDILRDAINMFLAANKELREKIAMELYKEGKIRNLSDMKELLTYAEQKIKNELKKVEKLKYMMISY